MRRAGFAALVLLSFAIGCRGGSPTSPSSASSHTAPTTTPTPTAGPIGPANGPPTIGCPNPLTLVSSSAAGAAVAYTVPAAEGGEGTVRVLCAPAPGAFFAIGTTAVECKATDSLDRTASCAFPVTLLPPARLSRVTYMAFGDSITAGEVTVPLVQVQSASYPTVLLQLMRSRYPSQFNEFVVANHGQGAEAVVSAYPRFVEAFEADHPSVVLLMEGYNDICCGANKVVDMRVVESALDAIAAEARHRGARVFIATLAPGHPGSKAIRPEYITTFNNHIRALAAAEGAVLVDVYGAILPRVDTDIGIDGLHPTESGYLHIAETFFSAIQREFEVK